MNEVNDVKLNEHENEVAIRTGIQAGDDGGGYMGSGNRQIIGSGS